MSYYDNSVQGVVRALQRELQGYVAVNIGWYRRIGFRV